MLKTIIRLDEVLMLVFMCAQTELWLSFTHLMRHWSAIFAETDSLLSINSHLENVVYVRVCVNLHMRGCVQNRWRPTHADPAGKEVRLSVTVRAVSRILITTVL